MPSTPSAYPQVISRHLASFRVVKPHLSAAQADFWAGFDSRQLHWENAGQKRKLWPVFFFINTWRLPSADAPVRRHAEIEIAVAISRTKPPGQKPPAAVVRSFFTDK
jgi:hypothetical protein